MRVITPTAQFPDQNVVDTMAQLGLSLVEDTVGARDRIQEWRFVSPSSKTELRYMLEPELEIPCIIIQGGDAEHFESALRKRLSHITGDDAARAYEAGASDDVKLTLLRIMSANALQLATDATLRAATIAVRDPSPFIRIGVAQLAQYAHVPEFADLVRARLLNDAEKEVSAFAAQVLDVFDASPD